MEPNIIHEGQNTGVIEVAPRPTDFMAGGETGLVHIANNPGGDWQPFMPPGEWQKDMAANFETDACVSFSADDQLETHANFCIAHNLFPAESVQWLRDNGYFNPDGVTLNFSDRFTARMSNTTINGNSLPNVGDSIRHFGLVPESAWPFPLDEIAADQVNAWAIYYKEVPQSVKDMGKAFLTHFTPGYEWVKIGAQSVDLGQQLVLSPLQIATAVCWPWNTDAPINACGPGAAHGTMLAKIEASGQADILDHYAPFVKHFAPGYDITYAMRHILQPVSVVPTSPSTFHYTFTKQLSYQNNTNDPGELHALQTALQTLKGPSGLPYLRANVYGPYGPQTKTAVAAFQKDNHIPDANPGADFGPMTRDTMNRALTH